LANFPTHRYSVLLAAILGLLAVGLGTATAHAAALNFQTSELVQTLSPATTLTIASGSAADVLQVNATSVAITVSSSTGGSFTVLSPSYDLSVATSSGGGTVATSCNSGVVSTTISQATGSTVYTITPGGTTCESSGPPVINSFTANPSSITSGNSSLLSWSVFGASSTTLDNGIGDVSDQTSTTVSPSQTTTYTLTVTDSAGSSTTAQATVSVTPASSGSGGGGSSGGGGGGGGGGYYFPPVSTTSTASSTTSVSASAGSLLSLLQELRSLTVELFTLSNTNNRSLTVGSQGTDVWALQVLLILDGTGPQAGKLAVVGPTGYFGSLTQRAVAEYQKANGVVPDVGYFGAKTKSAILSGASASASITTLSTTASAPSEVTQTPTSPSGPFTQDLYFGLSDAQVSTLQKFLAEDPGVYPQGLVTGYYGLATEEAVQRFQLTHDIAVSENNYGAVDAPTRASLNKLYLSGETP
jgi:peptidoglycan hydrolase-like protein with peptidoglycan-binding domain